MTKNSLRGIVALVAVGWALFGAADAYAQCCGGGTAAYYQPTAAYYQPSAAYYQPAAYTSYYAPTYQTYRPMFGGWYPGRLLGRINRAIWGVPDTYAVSYPSTYTAAYPAMYSASYAPSYSASYAPSYSAGYATTSYVAPACTTCAPACTTCAMPCTSCCDPCASCGVAGSAVTQAGYEQRSDCPNCAAGSTAYSESTTSQAPATGTQNSGSPPSTYGEQRQPEPALPPEADVPPREEVQRQPADNGSGASETPNDLEPEATPQNNGVEGSSTRFEAPPLFLNPQDRTAQRSPAPVRTAVLQRSASQASASAAPISWHQAEKDAAGWTSASK